MPKYMCQLCANHGQFYQPKKGHKQKCPHRDCPCNLCGLNSRRRALDQIERRLRAEEKDAPLATSNTTGTTSPRNLEKLKEPIQQSCQNSAASTKYPCKSTEFHSIDRLLARD